MNNKGFTLLEVLITITVFAMIASLIAQVFFTTTHINTKTEVMKEVKQNGDFALDVMTRMIRNSTSVSDSDTVSGSCTNAQVDALYIKNLDGNTTTFGCFDDGTNGVFRIASSSTTTTQYLTSLNVTLGDTCANVLQFTCSPSYFTKQVTIRFQLAQRGTPASQFEQAQMPFQITVSTRN